MESNLLIAAAKSGALDTLEWAVSIGQELYEDVFDTAAESGNISTLEWLLDKKCYWQASIWKSAARSKNMDAFLWLQKQDSFGSFSKNSCLESTIWGDNLELFKFLYTPADKDPNLLRVAIEKQQWEIADILLQSGLEIPTYFIAYICKTGNFTLMLQAHASGGILTTSCLVNAVASGNLEMIQWIRSKNIPWTYDCAAAAIKARNLKLLQHIYNDGCPLGTGGTVCSAAIRNNDMETLQWCLDHKCTLSSVNSASICAEEGHLEMLNFLWKNFRQNIQTRNFFEGAVKGGHLNMLRWAKKNYIPWGNSAIVVAASTGNVKTMEWLLNNGFYNDNYASDALLAAANQGHLLAAKWLVKHGAPWERTSTLYSRSINVIQYLVRIEKMELTQALARRMKEQNPPPHIVRWLDTQVVEK